MQSDAAPNHDCGESKKKKKEAEGQTVRETATPTLTGPNLLCLQDILVADHRMGIKVLGGKKNVAE